MGNNIIAIKNIKGFCLNCSNDWIYEGMLINLTTYSGEKFSNVLVESVLEEQSTVILKCDDTQKYVSLDDIDELVIIERRKVK